MKWQIHKLAIFISNAGGATGQNTRIVIDPQAGYVHK